MAARITPVARDQLPVEAAAAAMGEERASLELDMEVMVCEGREKLTSNGVGRVVLVVEASSYDYKQGL
jgi:hypothetical protein